MCERACVCPCTQALSDWPCAWADSPSVLACLWGRRGKRRSGCVCVCVQMPKPCQRVMGECVWETESGTRSCKVKSLPVHVTSWWREHSPPSFSPLVLRSFILDVFPGNAAVVSTLPKSHSHRLPLPSPKAAWEKICHLHHCGISALYELSKSGSAEREGFATEKENGLEMRVERPV